MDRVECKHNYGVGCADPPKCATCGWNPKVARRRIRVRKAGEVKKRKPTVTYFEKITASKEALAMFLKSLQVLDGPLDELFLDTFCAKCRAGDCNNCQHEAQRNNPAWFLAQEVANDGNDPLR